VGVGFANDAHYYFVLSTSQGSSSTYSHVAHIVLAGYTFGKDKRHRQ
jgi:hypothetical protein